MTIPVVRLLQQYFQIVPPPAPVVEFLPEKLTADASDLELVQYAESHDTMVLTADRGKRNRGPKLPLLLWERRILHVAMYQSVHQMKTHEKYRAIISVWNQIEAIWTARQPLGHGLQKRSNGFCLVPLKDRSKQRD